jgi:bifunctional non-homologous end joining protein LigD
VIYAPMLATQWPAPFDDPAWGFELKWDGVRALAHSDGRRLRLRSRNGNDLSERYPSLAALRLRPGVIDGELVAVDADGLPSFEKLARIGREHRDVQFVAFDILELGGDPVLTLPLLQRRELLLGLTEDLPITVNDLIPADGLNLFSVIQASGLEGMIAKKLSSGYEPGRRSGAWRKILNLVTVRCVVGGYTPSEVGEPFSALLMGLLVGDRLRYIGRVGSGFSNEDRRLIRSALDDMAGPDPFVADPDIPDGVFCIPQLVAHVQFRMWTDAGRLRGPVFKGFGSEPFESVTWEAEGPRTLSA